MSPAELSPPTTFVKSRLLKGMLIGFAACMTIGFALVTWYVGVRIVAAKESGARVLAPAPKAAGMIATKAAH
jgi:hypothetical protein